jgi:Methyltransferase small domain
VVGSDIVERCLWFARLNASLNNVAGAESDLFTQIDGDFDIIVSNAPCVWDELQQAVFATGGGAFGTELPMRMISGALDRLRPAGLLIVVMSAPIIHNHAHILDAVTEACAGHTVSADIHPLITEYELEHAPTYRRHGISEYVRYLVAITPAMHDAIQLHAPEHRRYSAYRLRAAAVRLADTVARATRPSAA